MSSFIKTVSELFERDIQKVIDEISKYNDDDDIWILPSGINNSAGTLALHIAGNLQHFIGAVLGKSGYVRNRDEEFETRDVSQSEIISELSRTKNIVSETLKGMDDDTLGQNFPESFSGMTVSNYFIITHLYGHMNYHLGQINYHRRLLTD